jgi:hypothetical protein
MEDGNQGEGTFFPIFEPEIQTGVPILHVTLAFSRKNRTTIQEQPKRNGSRIEASPAYLSGNS